MGHGSLRWIHLFNNCDRRYLLLSESIMSKTAQNTALINKLLSAEKEADAILTKAKEFRINKLREAHTAADEEIRLFKKQEAKRLENEFTAQSGTGDEELKALETTSLKDIEVIKSQYKQNKEKAMHVLMKYVTSTPKQDELNAEDVRQIQIRFKVQI